jgi:hypothetical protein
MTKRTYDIRNRGFATTRKPNGAALANVGPYTGSVSVTKPIPAVTAKIAATIMTTIDPVL